MGAARKVLEPVRTVAVVSSCTTATYWPFLVPWAQRVAALTRTPDEIVVATDAPEYARAAVDELLDVQWVTPTRTWVHHAAYLVNDAIERTTSEWIAKLDIDDLALPGYLDGIDNTDADVYCVGYRYMNHDHVVADWPAESILRMGNNPLASCSPFRRWLWQLQEWPDALFDDWVFWVRAAKAGAKFHSSKTIGYEYVAHPNQATKRGDLSAAQSQVDDERW